MRSSSTSNAGGSARRSILFRTTPAVASRGPAPYARARGRSCAKRSAASSSDESITCNSRFARSRCARNSWPSPTPSLAPSISPGTSATVSCRDASGASTVPSMGASVVNGYSATFGFAFEILVRSDDLPALGSPTSAASASSLRRRSNFASSPGRPVSAKRGARRVGDAKRLLPRPGDAAARRDHARSRRGKVGDQLLVLVEHLRPDRHAKLDRLAGRPVLQRAAAGLTAAGLVASLGRKADRSRRSGSATRTTSPPGPPSPPSGPPLGTCFSRRKCRLPSPPRPAWTLI